MSWEALLAATAQELHVLPWYGGRSVVDHRRAWRIAGDAPPEWGWYQFRAVPQGRNVLLDAPAEPDLGMLDRCRIRTGYLVGDRIVDELVYSLDPGRLLAQTLPVRLVEPGLERFARVIVAELFDGMLVFSRQTFPLGPEAEVTQAYQDRAPRVDHVPGVPPALDLAFRFLSRQRDLAEQRAAERERLRQEAERREAALRSLGTGAGRREAAKLDFGAAAKAALAVSDAELLDWRPSRAASEVVVQYRLGGRRFECVVERATLRIVDAGICLEDHDTGVRGDRLLTLESLPAVVLEAQRRRVLHVYRHFDD